MPSGFAFEEKKKAAPKQASSLGLSPKQIESKAVEQKVTPRQETVDAQAVEKIAVNLANAFGNNTQEVTRLAVDGHAVAVDDLQRDYAALLLQFAALPSFGVPEPFVGRVKRHGTDELVPFDYGFRDHDPALNDVLMPLTEKVERVARLIGAGASFGAWIAECGLELQSAAPVDVQYAFLRAAAHEILVRARAIAGRAVTVPGQGGGGLTNVLPPSHLFTVTTEPNRRIAVARGHFISSHQFFGQSSPAVSHLVPGYYMFGVYDLGGPKFPSDGLLVDVPAHLSYDLRP